jgi:hypothetical protein
MSNPLSGLKIDHWWHAFTVTGAAGFIAAIAVEPKVIPQRDLILLSLSLFIFGVGQWINHPLQERIVPGFKITGYHRSVHPLGICLELLGCVIFAIEVYRIAFTK